MADSLQDDAVARLRDGDPQLLGELFQEHQQRLLHVIRVRMDSRLAARIDEEDVLQEVYLDAAARIHHYIQHREGSFFIWLRLITTQTMANLYRRHLMTQRRDAKRDVSLNADHGPHSPAARPMAMQLIGHLTSPSKAAIRQESIEQLEQAIGDLKAIDREVIALRHFELLDNKEVAEVLGLTEKAASIRYIRAIKRLKDALPFDSAEENN